MRNHVLRPLFVVIGVVGMILMARMVLVPEDFGVQEAGYMYGWHRKSNEADWKAVTVKYKGSDYCLTCHPDKAELISMSPHVVIPCENCHGPAMEHPSDPPKLEINKNRELCLRCHAKLPYPGSGRMVIRGIEDAEHNHELECVQCHNPHKPGFN